jgi:hypothetical protein
VQFLSTTENEFKGLSVYPNPTTGIVNISGVEIEGASVSIVDISGRIISKNAATAKKPRSTSERETWLQVLVTWMR